uniref:F-box domain-containing protein n=1 Tax=Panagrolaimus sp. JU765 TaxID=591449 RepID=A0AC34RLQ2_9BILA
MDHFDLFSLPLEIQDMIVGEMVHNCPPDDWLHFTQTSKYSNWLVKRAHPKKIVKDLVLHIKPTGLIIFKSMGEEYFGTSDQLVGYFKNIQVTDRLYLRDEFNFEDETIWTLNFEREFLLMSEFVIKVDLTLPKQFNRRFLEFYQNLKNLKYLVICGNNINISLLPYIPSRIRFITFEEVDEFLICSKILAEKSKKFSLKGFDLDLGDLYPLDDVKNFLQARNYFKVLFEKNFQSATFFDDARIIFYGTFCVEEVKKMIKSIGGHDLPDGKTMLLKEKIQIVPTKADKPVNGIHILLWNTLLFFYRDVQAN